jgi:tetratricopeptide (TPR) repeat protein
MLFGQKQPESYFRAKASINEGKFEQAILWLDSSLALSRGNPNIWILKGEAFYRANRFENAIVCFSKAEEIRKGSSSIWLARTYSLLGDTLNAFTQLVQHLSLSPKQTEASIKLDTAFAKISKFPQWRAIWLKPWYSPQEIVIADVLYHFSHKEWDYAIDLLNEKIKGKRGNHQLFALRAQAYFLIGSLKAAEQDIKQAISKNKRNHYYYSWYATILNANGNFKKSLTQINHSIGLSGGEPTYYLIRAKAFVDLKKYGQAIDDVKHYLSFYPNNIAAIEQLTEYSVESGKNIEALLLLGRLIKQNPSNSRYFFLRGTVYMRSSNWEVARLDFDQAQKIDSKNSEVYLNRGICNHNLGKSTEACNDWRQAIKLGNFQAQELVFKNCR